MISNGKEGMSKLKFAYDFLGTELHRISRKRIKLIREILYNSVPERNKPQAFFILPHSLYSTVTAVPQAVTISILPLPPTVS